MTSDRAQMLRRFHAGLTGLDPGAHTALGQRRRGLTEDRFTREMDRARGGGGGCGCACCSGGFCGGCGHAGCGGR